MTPDPSFPANPSRSDAVSPAGGLPLSNVSGDGSSRSDATLEAVALENEAAALESEAAALAREAAAWRLLALLFERPRAGWHEEVRSLAEETGDPGLREVSKSARDATEGAYHAVLGIGGSVSPREVSHVMLADPGRLLASLSVFYEAFSYRSHPDEPHDHISAEAGFAGYLLLKSAYAVSAGDAESAALARTAFQRFLERHLGAFAWSLALRLEGSTVPYLAGAATLLAARCGPPRAEASESAPRFAAECDPFGGDSGCFGCAPGEES